MNESLELFQNLIGNGNYLDALRMLFHYPLGMWLDMYFTKMRDAKGLLRFVSFCRDIVDGEKDSISPEELERFDAVLIGLELSAYDRANDFDRYIALFEDTRKNKLYANRYAEGRDDPVFNQYVLGKDDRTTYVHFLYTEDYRYQIILRKKARQDAGKLPKTMLRHQPEDLPTEEITGRFEYMQWILSTILREDYGYDWNYK